MLTKKLSDIKHKTIKDITNTPLPKQNRLKKTTTRHNKPEVQVDVQRTLTAEKKDALYAADLPCGYSKPFESRLPTFNEGAEIRQESQKLEDTEDFLGWTKEDIPKAYRNAKFVTIYVYLIRKDYTNAAYA